MESNCEGGNPSYKSRRISTSLSLMGQRCCRCAREALRSRRPEGRNMTLRLSLAVCDYDRTRAIFDGRARVEGCAVTAVALEPEEAFHRAFKFSEFDISEISLSSYIMTTARGD